MCHRSQAADHSIKDLTEVYSKGDLVKAVVLKASFPANQINGVKTTVRVTFTFLYCSRLYE